MASRKSKTEDFDAGKLLAVLTAFKQGRFNVRMPVKNKGIGGKIAKTLNEIIALNEEMAKEFQRIEIDVGEEGAIEERAALGQGRNSWAACIKSVNALVGNLIHPTNEMARVIGAVARGDLSQTMALELDKRPLKGQFLRTAQTVNSMVAQLGSFASEVTRVAREVGTEGNLGGQAQVKGVAGTWKDLTDNVNLMALNLTAQVRNIAAVTTAVAKGDLTKKIKVEVKGEILALKNTINTMVDQLGSFASEVTRVAREVGTEGKLGGQAQVKGVAGTWKGLTDNVNLMASNLTAQVRNIAEVTTAVAKGDLSKKITVKVGGEILRLKNTINTMVDQLNSFASEVTRVAREVGTEGKLGGQAQVKGVAGTWKDLSDNVNSMASNLTAQVRNIAEVTTAVAKGDLSKQITVDVKGEILQLKKTINTMVDQLRSFASEVTRVAREVGTEGKLGGQAQVKGIAGTWKDLTDNVNSMASNLTSQVRNIAEVTKAVAGGDLSKKITVDVKGEIFDLKNTINVLVDQLSSFASEVTRVAREVGTEGKLGGQAQVKGVAGTWKDLTDNVNFMASNLTNQVRNIAQVTTAVAMGDLSKKITVDVKGEILELKNTINTMVDQLGSFASEVTRVAREVGTEGKLGGQATVKGVAGTWKDLTDNVNSMATNLTDQVRNIADVTTAVAKGDLSKKITVDVRGEILELKDTINIMVDQLNSFASEVTRVAREVGTEGKLGGQAIVKGVAGTWKDLTDNVNSMASNLTSQVRNIADVTTAVAKGDLSKKITVTVQGEILELKNTINTMVDQLSSFASEVTRVAREVGTEGKLGGQATVKGVAGTWKDLTDNVNSMAANLTTQVRGIAKVVTAVANGDLKRKLILEVKGEIAELAETINGMIDTLAVFADQVTTVAREVGIEGKLGGQASVPGAAGLWRHLTDNVNQLAANLTTQVRAIADVATAVTKGDLTRSIAVEAQGEVASLKDNINEMIRNLKETTRKNTEQDWLKTNLAKFTRMLQGQRDLLAVSQLILSELAPLVEAQHGVFYIADTQDKTRQGLRLLAGYAHKEGGPLPPWIKIGEGLIGQCAVEKESFRLTDIPEDFVPISTALGEAPPRNIAILPALFEGEVKAVIELASLRPLTDVHMAFLEQLTESIGIVLNTIAATTRTEELLKQSQALTEELKETNRRLEQQNQEVEQKNREVEQARVSLEEKAAQLALTSRYKSQFLANTSHELRTPLNSLLILSKTLTENQEGNLTPKQIEFAKTIHASGSDLLELINDILDLSKIESGTMVLDIGPIPFQELYTYVERSSRHVALAKGLEFSIDLAPDIPQAITTDSKRLQQVLKNLLSNAFKFTERGHVSMHIAVAREGWSPDNKALNSAPCVISLSVSDTGIGIPKDKQQIIFEAFQQADGTTNRKYGGTGLGLSISREIARLLGGELGLKSAPGEGSTFTLFLPISYIPPSNPRAMVSIPPPSGLPEQASEAVPMDGIIGAQAESSSLSEVEMSDDRASIQTGDTVLLIVDDDSNFSRIVLDMARASGFKVLASSRADRALSLTKNYRPQAIILDIGLPDADGWIVLDLIKHDMLTRHIPVYIISGGEDRRRGIQLGAMGFLQKPVTKEMLEETLDRIYQFAKRNTKRLLIVGGDDSYRDKIMDLIGNEEIQISAFSSGEKALESIKAEVFDCLIVNPSLSDIGVAELLRILVERGVQPAVILYGVNKISKEQADELARLSDKLIVKEANSPEKLLDYILLLMHKSCENLQEPQKRILELARQDDQVLAGRKVLIVDDDVRNIFALTSVLERYKMQFVYAESGRQALASLNATQDIDIVLMDIMMPAMDGYETMRAIRRVEKFQKLPIIALTAKAMKGDREKCIEAGASDYIAKPVDMEHLCSLLRVWLSPKRLISL